MWLRKLRDIFLTYRIRKKYKYLELIVPGDRIYITTPKNHTITIGGKSYSNLPVSVSVENNDPLNRKLWVKLTLSDHSELDRIIPYNSYILDNYILLNIKYDKNIFNVDNLEEELKAAILSENFEMAALINEKIKKKCRK